MYLIDQYRTRTKHKKSWWQTCLSMLCLWLGGAVLGMSVGAQASADPADPTIDNRVILGWLEQAYVANMPHRLRAKLDSGAKTSSIHGRVMGLFEHDGVQWLAFEFDWFEVSRHQNNGVSKSTQRTSYIIHAPVVRQVRIKDHKNMSDVRWVVRLPIMIAGQCWAADFNIADRSRFNYAILLGRDFLRDAALVDVRETFVSSQYNRTILREMVQSLPANTKAQKGRLNEESRSAKKKRKLPMTDVHNALMRCDSIGITIRRAAENSLAIKAQENIKRADGRPTAVQPNTSVTGQ